jgi:hypothetical protein
MTINNLVRKLTVSQLVKKFLVYRGNLNVHYPRHNSPLFLPAKSTISLRIFKDHFNIIIQNMRMWEDNIIMRGLKRSGLGYGEVAGCCEEGNKLPGF